MYMTECLALRDFILYLTVNELNVSSPMVYRALCL